MVDSKSECNNTDDSNDVNSSPRNSAAKAAAAIDKKSSDHRPFNLSNQPPANSQIPGQFNYFEQHYRHIPEDQHDETAVGDQKHYAAVYKTTSPRLSFDNDHDDDQKYAPAKINSNGGCTIDNCEKYPHISSITPIANANVARADFETAIELTGYGKFHYYLLAICGLVR